MMTQPVANNEPEKIRIANFSQMELPFKNVLNFDLNNIQHITDEIRRYADLPYVYILSVDQVESIIELLKQLKSIRSTCFPYALFLDGDSEQGSGELLSDEFDLDVIRIDNNNPETINSRVKYYAASKFVFDNSKLKFENNGLMPNTVDVIIVGAGVTGLYAANKLLEENISFCVLDKRDIVGGIWSKYANVTSQVNTSEGGYRLIEQTTRSHSDHSATREILEDIGQLSKHVSDKLFLSTTVDRILKVDDLYQVSVTRGGDKFDLTSKGVILAINDRVGEPRKITWENQQKFQGNIVSGISDKAKDIDWNNKKVVIVGMGAFAVENARTALVGGASHVTVVCRRHGTVCPKIIDYLNFATPYDENFKHDKKSNLRNMMLWKKVYDQSGATHPESWPRKIKHAGHTISVSDIWFIGHYLNKIETITGNISGMYEDGVIVDDKQYIEADVVVNCVGFYRNAPIVKELCDYSETYNNNYLDKDLIYLADAYIDDDAFNSFFGSSVLEMVKFYMDVYVKYFDNPEFDTMMQTDGIKKLSIEDRKWTDYIAGASALIKNYPELNEIANKQVNRRTKNFLESHDLETYISQNKREWIDTHSLLAGKTMKEEDCLPFVFQKLIE
jgi:hypothetical protein